MLLTAVSTCVPAVFLLWPAISAPFLDVSVFPHPEMGKTVAKADWEVKKRSSVLDMIGLKHLLDIQSEKSNGDKAREV